jgi:hypothetical protein
MAKLLKKTKDETRLQRTVRVWLNSKGQHYESGWKGAYKDLEYGGCQSGVVGELIYYSATVKFYKRHQREIDVLLKDMLEESGRKSPADLFDDKWDAEDPLAREQFNQNLLAWFGFEETVSKPRAYEVCSHVFETWCFLLSRSCVAVTAHNVGRPRERITGAYRGCHIGKPDQYARMGL